MPRDDFAANVKRDLSARVNLRCSNPECRSPTSGPQVEAIGAVSIGVAAHITAASPGGPRYHNTLSGMDRSGSQNGIWLCQNCAKRIDSDPARYTEELLRHWKQNAELTADKEMGRPGSVLAVHYPVEIGLDYKLLQVHRDQTGEAIRHDYDAVVTLTNPGATILRKWYIELEFPRIMRMPSLTYGNEVEANRARPDLLLRRSPIRGNEPLFPHSTVSLKATYIMNDQLFDQGEGLLHRTFKARAIVDDVVVAETEKTVDKMQDF